MNAISRFRRAAPDFGRAALLGFGMSVLLLGGMAVLAPLAPRPAWCAELLRAPYLVFPTAPDMAGLASLGPVDVAAGDLNGDGRADLAVVCRDGWAIQAGTMLSVFLSEPNPTLPLLGSAAGYVAATGPNHVALGDVSGDGLLDVVTTEADTKTVSVFLNRGGGQLGIRRAYSLSGATPKALVVRDLNADGRADVAVLAGTAVVVFLAGSTPGTLLLPNLYPVSGNLITMAAGPVDADAAPDLVVATRGPNALALLHGVGDGTFTAAGTSALLYDPESVELADMTGNGTREAIVSTFVGHVTVYGNDGGPPFATAIADVALEGSAMDVIAGDFDSDGANDIAAVIQIGSGGSFRTGVLLKGNGGGGFLAPVSFDFGPFLEAVAAGDLNGDGRLDLAACGAGRPSELQFQRAVNVALQSASGGFGIGSSYRVAANDIITGKIAQADMNRDGKADLIVCGVSGGGVASVTIRPGLGDGTWDPGFEFIVPGNLSPVAIPGDMNRDGKMDLVVTVSSSGGTPLTTTYLGNGDGTIAPLGSSNLNGQTVLAVGDFDRDGRLDLLTSDPAAHELVCYRGHGDGTFLFVWASPPTGSGPDQAGVADLNRDGKQDVVASFPGAGTGGMLGNGNGTFGPLLIYSTNPESFTVENVDEDGIPDLLSSENGATYFGRGDGNGTFTYVAQIGGPGPQTGSTGRVVTDVNRDGRPDVIFDNGGESFFNPIDSKLTTLLGNGSLDLGARSSYGVGRKPLGLIGIDANRDGRDDVVALEGDYGFGAGTPWLVTLLGNGSPPTFNFPTDQPVTPLPTPPLAMVSADFNRDGRPDLVVARSEAGGDVTQLLIGNGNGTFQPRISTADPPEPEALAVGDLNRDGIPDLAVACGAGDAVLVQLGTPYDSLSTPITVALGLGYEFSDIAIGDFNRDGRPDLAAASAASYAILIFPGNGDGTFGAPLAASTGSAGPTSIAVGDMNRDGIPDLAAALGVGIAPDAIAILLGRGDGTFQTARPYTVGATPFAIIINDLNRDGIPDVAVTRTGIVGSRFITVLQGGAGGGFSSVTSYPIPGNAPDLAAADIDGDGVLDLFAPNGLGNDTFAFLHGLGNGAFASDTDYFLPGSPVALSVADFNHDGRLDVAGAGSAVSWVFVYTSSPSTVSAVPVHQAQSGEGAPPAPRLSVRPNPASEQATLSLQLPAAGPARVEVFDAAGRLVARVFDGVAERETVVRWDGRTAGGARAAAGVYFARLTAGNAAATRRVVWVR